MTTLRSVSYSLMAWSSLGLTARDAMGHPSSGIVVDAKGQVFFQDAVGRTIWKIDPEGNLSQYSAGIGGHWMALDEGHRPASCRNILLRPGLSGWVVSQVA